MIPAREGHNFNPLFQTSREEMFSSLKRVLKSADAGWYLDIAKNGYSEGPSTRPQNWVFFPLYPGVIYLVKNLIGGYFWAAMLISNGCFLFSLIFLERLAIKLGYGDEVATRSVWFLALFPISYFFSAPFSESLFLLLLVGIFLTALSKQIIISGLLLALLTACRPTGILVLPAYFMFLVQQKQLTNYKSWISLFLAPLGILAFMLYLWFSTGDVLSFANNQLAWGRNKEEVQLLVSQVFSSQMRLVGPWDFHILNLLFGTLALLVAVFLAVKREWAFALLIFAPLIVSLGSGFTLSLSRHVSVLFPIYLVLARVCSSQSRERAIIAIFACLLGAMTIAYGLHVTAAMT